MAEHVLVAGEASGAVLVLDEPLSFWGGLDTSTGLIIDQRHPQLGCSIAGSVLAMPVGRGSSSGSSSLAEAIRSGTGPVAIVMREPDEIVALGAVVADELYGICVPVVVVDTATFGALETGAEVRVGVNGTVRSVDADA